MALHGQWTQGSGGKTLTVVQAKGSGDAAWFLAHFAEGHDTGEGVSLNVCVRAADGAWRIEVCSLTAA